jgi:hypothetical protein
MRIWVDDIREPPDEDWVWAKTSQDALDWLMSSQICGHDTCQFDIMSLDHDLGGDDTTRPIVLWMCENDFWPVEVRCHSANPVGIDWIEGMIERYKP